MSPMQILTHRGLEPSKSFFYSESTKEAFHDHLSRGFGLEIDLNFTADGIVLYHDATLKRLTGGKDERALKNLTTAEVLTVHFANGHLCTFEYLMELAKPYPQQLLALHFKGAYQEEKNVKKLIQHLAPYQDRFNQLLIFDLMPQAATRLKQAYPTLLLAASVVHPLDQKRYQIAAQGTLLTMDELLAQKELYAAAWLDEWEERLYTREVFTLLRKEKMKIFLVTPELHGTSPGLLGGEAHPDATPPEKLFRRIQEIISLQPDGVCTDYPEEIKALL